MAGEAGGSVANQGCPMSWDETDRPENDAQPARAGRRYTSWIVGACLAGLILIVELIFQDADTITQTTIRFGYAAVAFVVFIGLHVWRWREESRAEAGADDDPRSRADRFMRKCGAIVGIGVIVAVLGPNLIDGWRMNQALRDPSLAEFTVERFDRTTVRFDGAINDQSVAAVLRELDDRRVKTLWITSHGGLIDPAEQLASRVRSLRVEVVAEDYCISACVMVLVASPNAAAVTETEITFHQPQEVIHALDRRNAISDTERLDGMRSYFARFDLPDWAIERMLESEYWTPTCKELVEMGIIQYVYDRESRARYSIANSSCA